MKLKSKLDRQLILVTAILIGVIAFFVSFYVAASQNKDIAGSSCQVDHCVALTSQGAKPDEIYVKVGSSVQFNSADGNSHELSLGKGGETHNHSGPFHSGEFQADEAWRATFKEAGTFFFHDHKNPQINVLVVVYDKNPQVE